MKEKQQDINKELLNKYFGHKCTPEEKEKVRNWFDEPYLERKLKYMLRDQWEEIDPNTQETNVDSGRILDMIHHKLHKKEWKNVYNRSFLHKFYDKFSRIAAILILPVIIFSGWYIIYKTSASKAEKINYAEIFSPLGARTHFELPDGSGGWLNSGSTLKFPVKFHGPERKVLLKGEGYFDVIKNPKRPFVVKTGDIEVMALGTRFNVLNYPDDKFMDITLESGMVAVNNIYNNKKVFRLTELTPEEQVSINKVSKKFNKRKVVSQNYTAWKQGMLIFRNDPMDVVVKRLERWYNAEIIIKDKKIESYRYRATFEDETLEEVLKLLKLSSPIDYIKAKRKKLPDGSFSKKKITLFIKPGYENKIN